MTPEVAASKEGDPVLDQALSEMSTEGLLDEPGDPAGEAASQALADESAEVTAAPDKAVGDDGSAKAVAQGTPADDPLSGTEPFKYSSNGETKSLDGVYRVPGEGLLVPEDKVSVIEGLAERADTLDRVSRDLESRNADYERLSEWRTTGADGKEQVYQGRDGLVAMRTELSTRAAAFDVLASVLSPDKDGNYSALAKLVTVDQNNRIVPDPEYLDKLLLRADLAERDARDRVRAEVGQLSKPQAQGPDWNQIAPSVIDSAIKSSGLDTSSLTKEDREFLAGQIDRYERKITEADRQQNRSLRVGDPIIDAKFTALVKQTAQSRIASTKQVLAAEKAGRHNAGMQKGRQPAAPPKTPPAKTPAVQTKTGKADWDTPLAQALAEMDIQR